MPWIFGRRKPSQQPPTTAAPTVELLADDLASSITSAKHLDLFPAFLRQTGQSPGAYPNLRSEWLAISLFAVLKGILGATRSEALRQALIPAVQRSVYNRAFSSDEEQSIFEDLFFERMRLYDTAFLRSEDSPLSLGLLFAENLVGSPDPSIAMFVRQIFHSRMVATHQFVSQVGGSI